MTIRWHNSPRNINAHNHGYHRGNWLPRDHGIIKEYVDDVVRISRLKPAPRSPSVRALEQAVNRDGQLFMLFNKMLVEPPTQVLAAEHKPYIRDLPTLWAALETIISSPPPYRPGGNDGSWAAQVIALPTLALLVYPMATEAGFAAFLNDKVNNHFAAILSEWALYLSSPSSTGLIRDWVKILGGSQKFNEDFIAPDPSNHDTYGFQSWDAFFTRHFKPGVRPVGCPSDGSILVNPCESQPYYVQVAAQAKDGFWMKGQRYSLAHMLNWNEYCKTFINGTVYQAFLSATDYHRWHAPLSGTIIHKELIPGSYFSTPIVEHLDPPETHQRIVDSQAYLSAVAARGAIIMKADNPQIGVIGLVFIGMGDVSSVDLSNMQVGQHFKKGDELGMFHYGGSSYCLLLEPGLKIKWFLEKPNEADPGSGKALLLNQPLAKIERSRGAGPASQLSFAPFA